MGSMPWRSVTAARCVRRLRLSLLLLLMFVVEGRRFQAGRSGASAIVGVGGKNGLSPSVSPVSIPRVDFLHVFESHVVIHVFVRIFHIHHVVFGIVCGFGPSRWAPAVRTGARRGGRQSCGTPPPAPMKTLSTR